MQQRHILKDQIEQAGRVLGKIRRSQYGIIIVPSSKKKKNSNLFLINLTFSSLNLHVITGNPNQFG